MITVNKNEFLNAIKAVKTVIGKSALQPVLLTIHLKTENGGLTLTATDCTDTARAVIEANILENIDLCVNAQKLEEIVSRLDDDIKIEVKAANIIFKSGKTVFKSLYVQASEFPNISIKLSDENDKVILSKDAFITGVNKTVFATADYESRSVICNVCFTFEDENGYELAATDGNRLSQVKFNVPIHKKGKYIIPKQALISIAKTIKNEVEIYFSKEVVIFKTDNFIYVSRMFNGEFPPYAQLIPKTFEKTIEIKKSELLKALDKISVMVNERTNICKFIFTENNLQLFAETPNSGEVKDDLEINYSSTDEEFIIAFNYKYVIEGLKVMETDTVTFNMNSNLSAVLIKGDYTYLVMPVQLK